MSQSILIVNNVATNRIVLNVKLSAAQYTVHQAHSGAAALRVLRTNSIDMVLLDVDLPDMDGTRLCRNIRALPRSKNCLILAAMENEPLDKKKEIMAAGADDYLQKPVDDKILLARVRRLFRARAAETELQLRDGTAQALGFAEAAASFQGAAHISVVAGDRTARDDWRASLQEFSNHRLEGLSRCDALSQESPELAPDIFVISARDTEETFGLSLLTELRSNPNTRHSGIVVVLPYENHNLSAIALDMGADDLVYEGFDPAELSLRLNVLIDRKRQNDTLRQQVRTGLQAAVTDQLTGLFNRRYAMPHLKRIADRAKRTDQSFAVMILDLDHFKQVNDQYGHATGDKVLAEVAKRLRDNLRPFDMVARFGGEEFLIVMPDTPLHQAKQAAERIRKLIAKDPIEVPFQDSSIHVSTSIGVAVGSPPHRSTFDVQQLLNDADSALYDAKAEGRNQVTLARGAAA
ncbi:diguanylate cyclase [Algirhabdus cladophorae]|uniref:diguanylate cyclase n=1 Tax=Algirhabdus cladophorae TaxID=3377108 RepID=UPI003B8479E6